MSFDISSLSSASFAVSLAPAISKPGAAESLPHLSAASGGAISKGEVHGKPEDAALEKLGAELLSQNVTLKFRRDDESGRIVIELFDQSTGEKLQQIPDETLLHLSSALGQLRGHVFSRKT